MMQTGSKVGLVVAMVLAQAPLAQADATIDRLLASHCAQCHGTNGSGAGFDSLAGESEQELLEEMLEMRAEDPLEDIMEHQALGYSEAQLRRIAAYFADLPEPDDDDPIGVGDCDGLRDVYDDGFEEDDEVHCEDDDGESDDDD